MSGDSYWIGRFILLRGIFCTYLIGFLVAERQFIPLAGTDGILPFSSITREHSFWSRPSLLHVWPTNNAVRIICRIGLIGSTVGLLGIEWFGTIALSVLLVTIWALYLSLVNTGGLFYRYCWETLLCEMGILGALMGGAHQAVPRPMTWLVAWLLFRIMLEAGLLKLRRDECWWNLTCMEFQYETQPMPNPLSWFAHHMPRTWHRIEALGNHFVELVVPFVYFLPQPFSGAAGLITAGFHGWLMLTGNFAWLNVLPGVLALALIPDDFYPLFLRRVIPDSLSSPPALHQYAVYTYVLLVIAFSYWPLRSLFSDRAVKNRTIDPFHLVNTYGVFGSIARTRHELEVQGRRADGEWRSYEFRGKPTNPCRRPSQWAPYHLRLDWQLWFAAIRKKPRPWLFGMMKKLLEGDRGFRDLLQNDPFAGGPSPDRIRILRYRYRFSDPSTLRREGRWWEREQRRMFVPAMTLEQVRNRTENVL